MKTFKRPMFRKGGNVGNGIMSGITDRVQAQEGYPNPVLDTLQSETIETAQSPGINVDIGTPKTTAEYIEELKAGAGEYGGMDPLTSFLLTAGPSVAGATSFADAIQRLKPGTQQLLKDAEAKAKYDRDIRMAGTKLGLADQQKFDDRRFQLALKADDRSYQDFLREDERNYLAGVKKDDRIYQKGLIDDERKFNLELLEDQRRYDKLQLEDKRVYDAKILEEARKYQNMKDEEKREYEKKLIEEGRQFELDQIIRKEEFQLKLLDKELKMEEQFTVKDFAEEYKGSKNQASNRVKFENQDIEAKIIDKFGDKNFGGLIGGEVHGRTDRKLKNAKDRDVGKVYFDVMDGKVKRLRKTKEGYKFEIIEDVATFVEPEAPEVTTTTEKEVFPESGLFTKQAKPPKKLKEILPDFRRADDLPGI
jgi:hypothetical protein